MRVIEQIIPHLLGGISKQPQYLRGVDQSISEENTFPTFSRGLLKRPHTTYLKTLQGTPCFTKALSFGENEDTLLVIHDGTLSLIPLGDPPVGDPSRGELQGGGLATDGSSRGEPPMGEALTLSIDEQAKAYLKGTKFACVTWGNTTYILNKDIVTRMSLNDGSPASGSPNGQALVTVRQAVAKTRYEVSVTVGGTTKTATVTAAVTASEQNPNTDSIAADLETRLRSELGSPFTITRRGAQLLIASAQEFTLVASDSFGNNALSAIKDAVNDFAHLPKTAFDGFTVEVTTDPRAKKDSYYLVFQKGIWQETVKPGLGTTFDPSTMPHKLERTGYRTFTFTAESWGDRIAGDETTAPTPSFAGQPLSDIFAFKGRLGVLSCDNVVFSEVDAPTNFWPTTTAVVLDSDPIDIIVSHTSPIDLRYAIPTSDGNLLLFADSDQFVLSAKEGVTPHTISVNVFSHFDCTDSRPVAIEQSIVFGCVSDCYSDIKEITPPKNETSALAADTLTDQVPDFIPRDIKKIVSIPQAKAVFVLSTTTPCVLYVYKYQWKGETKVQSAWTQWTYSYPIIDIEASKGQLLLITGDSVSRDMSGTHSQGIESHLEGVSLGSTMPPQCTVSNALVDRLTSPVRAVYDKATDLTTLTLPYSARGDTLTVLSQDNLIIPIHSVSGVKVMLKGNYSSASLTVGHKYTLTYTFPPFVPRREGSPGQTVSCPGGRLLLKYMTITFENTAQFSVLVKVNGEIQGFHTFGDMGGVATSHPTSGATSGRIPLLSQAEGLTVTLVHDVVGSCAFQNAAWSGIYAKQTA